MHWIDWSIVLATIVFFVAVGYGTKRYTRSVADFLAAIRCAVRYLLTHASNMAYLGALLIIGHWQQLYTSGMGAGWWGHLMKPLILILALVGWVTYRFRETKKDQQQKSQKHRLHHQL